MTKTKIPTKIIKLKPSNENNITPLPSIKRMEFETFYNWDLPIEDLIACEQRTLNWLLTLDDAEESIERVKGNIAYLKSKLFKRAASKLLSRR